MKVGIIGAGDVGTRHAEGWVAAGADIAAVVAGPGSPPTALADRYGATACKNLAQLLERVDVVDICTPTHLHADYGLAAAHAGKHVVCEGPLARGVEAGEGVLAACREAGVQLLVGHVVRFFPEYAAAKAAVDHGAVGTPAVLRLRRSTFRPPTPTENWLTDPAKSGGLVYDLMIHDLDYARWVAGDVLTVFARSVRGVDSEAPVDHAVAVLQHRSEVLTHIEASWAYPPPTFRTAGEVAGDAGLLAWDSDRTDPVRVWAQATPADGDLPQAPPSLAESPYTTEISHFLSALRDELPPSVTAEDGLAALRLADAVDRSIASGQPVRVAQQEG